MQAPPTPRKRKSFFEGFYVIQDGVISLSLGAKTVIGCLVMTVSLVWMLFDACEDDTFFDC